MTYFFLYVLYIIYFKIDHDARKLTKLSPCCVAVAALQEIISEFQILIEIFLMNESTVEYKAYAKTKHTTDI